MLLAPWCSRSIGTRNPEQRGENSEKMRKWMRSEGFRPFSALFEALSTARQLQRLANEVIINRLLQYYRWSCEVRKPIGRPPSQVRRAMDLLFSTPILIIRSITFIIYHLFSSRFRPILGLTRPSQVSCMRSSSSFFVCWHFTTALSSSAAATSSRTQKRDKDTGSAVFRHVSMWFIMFSSCFS